MIAKNVSTRTLNLPELDAQCAQVAPGEQIDLSRFSEQQKMQCVNLQTAFEVGDMVIVSVGTTAFARKKRLEATQDRLTDLGLGAASVPVSATPIRNRGIKSLDKRIQQGVLPPRATPPEQDDEPRIEEVPEERGIIAVSPTSIQVLKPELVSSVEQKKSLPPEEIKELAAQFKREKCQGLNNNDKPCGRRAVIGYPYCLAHMSSDMREQYRLERLKKVRRTG